MTPTRVGVGTTSDHETLSRELPESTEVDATDLEMPTTVSIGTTSEPGGHDLTVPHAPAILTPVSIIQYQDHDNVGPKDIPEQYPTSLTDLEMPTTVSVLPTSERQCRALKKLPK